MSTNLRERGGTCADIVINTKRSEDSPFIGLSNLAPRWVSLASTFVYIGLHRARARVGDEKSSRRIPYASIMPPIWTVHDRDYFSRLILSVISPRFGTVSTTTHAYLLSGNIFAVVNINLVTPSNTDVVRLLEEGARSLQPFSRRKT